MSKKTTNTPPPATTPQDMGEVWGVKIRHTLDRFLEFLSTCRMVHADPQGYEKLQDAQSKFEWATYREWMYDHFKDCVAYDYDKRLGYAPRDTFRITDMATVMTVLQNFTGLDIGLSTERELKQLQKFAIAFYYTTEPWAKL